MPTRPTFEIPAYQQGTVLTKKGDLPPATQQALEDLIQKAPFMTRRPSTPRPPGSSSRVPPRFGFMNRPALIKPQAPNYSIITGGGGRGGGATVEPQTEDVLPTTDDKIVQPWFKDPKKVLPLALGAAALLFFFYKKR